MFYHWRYRGPKSSLFERLWQAHDDRPLPPALNKAARSVLNATRIVRHKWKHRDLVGVPDKVLTEPQSFNAIPLPTAREWFTRIHRSNEAVYNGNGSWLPQPFSGHSGSGIPMEEVVLRIEGYLAAFRGTKEITYLARALEAGDYILRERLMPGGHVILQGHHVADWSYSLTANALISLWLQDQSRSDYFAAAQAICGQLLRMPIAGSVNHGGIPAQPLSMMYRHTGERRFLDAATKRVMRRLVALQHPGGYWEGHEARIWYQAVNLRTLVSTFMATPSTTEFTRSKDRLASTITRTVNYFTGCQNPDGSLPLNPYGMPERHCEKELVEFEDDRFRRVDLPSGYPGHGAFEVDGLVTAYEHLGIRNVVPVLHGYAASLIRSQRLWRLEFNTLGAGRYLGFAAALAAEPAASRRSADDHPTEGLACGSPAGEAPTGPPMRDLPPRSCRGNATTRA